jgi:hypothetical protein
MAIVNKTINLPVNIFTSCKRRHVLDFMNIDILSLQVQDLKMVAYFLTCAGKSGIQ